MICPDCKVPTRLLTSETRVIKCYDFSVIVRHIDRECQQCQIISRDSSAYTMGRIVVGRGTATRPPSSPSSSAVMTAVTSYE